MAKLPRAKNPFTPTMRRFLSDVFKPAPALGKRARSSSRSHSSSEPPHPVPGPAPACVALQNEDPDTDTVVITALHAVPFCCHADLLAMPRAHLLAVARALNAALPHALQIDAGPARSDARIRNAIEMLVGLRLSVPPAPRANRSHGWADDERGVLRSPTSPLANRSRSESSLGVLHEEDESGAGYADGRAHKRRRIVPGPPEEPNMILRDLELDTVNRRVTRSQSTRAAADINSPTPVGRRVIRTRSERLPATRPMIQIQGHPNITLTRGRSAGRGYLRSRSAALARTSTPKRMREECETGEAEGPRSSAMTPTPDAGAADSGRVRVGKGVVMEIGPCEDTAEMTFGIHGMTIGPVESSEDMDLTED